MWALITEAALGYTLDIPDWFKTLVLFSLIFSVPVFVFRIIKSFFIDE